MRTTQKTTILSLAMKKIPLISLLVTMLAACQVPNMLPGGSGASPGIGQIFGKNTTEERPAHIPQIRNPSDHQRISYVELVKARLALPARPTPPEPPRLIPVDKGEYINTDVGLTHNERATLALLGDGSVRPPKLAVISDPDQISTLSGGTVPNYVGDVFYAQLQARGVAIVDRDYKSYFLDERAGLGQAVESGLNPKDPGASASKFQINPLLSADYLVVLHAVPIPGGLGGVRVQELELPLDVDPQSWTRYSAARDKYLMDVEQYNAAVTAYDEKCHSLVKTLEYASMKPGSEDLPLELRAQRALDGLKVDIETLLSRHGLKENGAESKAASAMLQSQSLASLGELSGDGLMRSLDSLTRLQAIGSEGRTPEVIVDSNDRVYGSPQAVLVEKAPSRKVSAYEFAVSVRVIHLQASTAEWFGTATCRDVSLTEAVERTCSRLIDAMMGA